MRFIRKAQALGFSLNEIAQLLVLQGYPEADMGEIKALAQAKIEVIQSKIDDLTCIKQGLAALVDRCPGRGSTACCPILGAMLDDDD